MSLLKDRFKTVISAKGINLKLFFTQGCSNYFNPDHAWHVISMDVIEALPKSEEGHHTGHSG